MRIAVTYENGQIFQHFGHTSQFKIYQILDGKVVASTVVDTNGNGHGALAELLKSLEVDALICGGIGGGAQLALAERGIAILGGVQGDADSAIEALLSNTLEFSSEANCDHHGHEEGHSCGNHHCGSHSCH